MLRLSMLLGCIFVTTGGGEEGRERKEQEDDGPGYSVTCYMCVNVSDNPVCNRYAIDRPCAAGHAFCHTLHIMDSHGRSVLVNKKCATELECHPANVGCVTVDTQLVSGVGFYGDTSVLGECDNL